MQRMQQAEWLAIARQVYALTGLMGFPGWEMRRYYKEGKDVLTAVDLAAARRRRR